MRVVSLPAVGSVTPNACSRSVPAAICGSHRCFCSGEPCRRIVPIVYICAWHADALPPDALISSRTTLASSNPSPAPPNSLRDEHAEPAAGGQRGDELLRVAVRLEPAPVLAREARAELGDRGADVGVVVHRPSLRPTRPQGGNDAIARCLRSSSPRVDGPSCVSDVFHDRPTTAPSWGLSPRFSAHAQAANKKKSRQRPHRGDCPHGFRLAHRQRSAFHGSVDMSTNMRSRHRPHRGDCPRGFRLTHRQRTAFHGSVDMSTNVRSRQRPHRCGLSPRFSAHAQAAKRISRIGGHVHDMRIAASPAPTAPSLRRCFVPPSSDTSTCELGGSEQ